MRTSTFIATAVFVSAGLSSVASAGFRDGELVTLQDDSRVSVSFVSQSAGATGSLYFSGHELGGVMDYAVSSDTNNLGEFLFSNHGTSAGTSIDLGTFDAGSTLHFSYLVTRGSGGAKTGDLFQSADSVGVGYFASEEPDMFTGGMSYLMGVEDIKNPKKSDFDYNDVVFEVSAASIPTPGSMALAFAGLGMVVRTRGRRG